MGSASLSDLIQEATQRLGSAGLQSARLEAEVLVAWLLGCSRAGLVARGREEVSQELEGRVADLVRRRVDGAPLQYLTGAQEFWSLPFEVDARVLIPRPETELLVEEILDRTPGARPRIADIGTGSGCIAIAVAHERPGAMVLATDISADALRLARVNAGRLVPDRSIGWILGDLLEPIAPRGELDVIASNPPYVSASEYDELPRDVREHEPRGALYAGPTGLEVIERLVAGAADRLAPGGCLALEIGAGQWPRVQESLRADRRFFPPEVKHDFQDIPRVVTARRRPRGAEEAR